MRNNQGLIVNNKSVFLASLISGLFLSGCFQTSENGKDSDPMVIRWDPFLSAVDWLRPQPQGNSLRSVDFSDANVGFAVGEIGTMLKTMDGGNTWKVLGRYTDQTLNSIDCPGLNTCYAVDDGGHFLKTLDGGLTWTVKVLGSALPLHAIHFTDEITGYIVGDAGVIFKTRDGGATWSLQASGTTQSLKTIHCPIADTCYAAGQPAQSSFVLKTVNGGNDWILFPIVLYPIGLQGEITSLFFLNTQIGIAVLGGSIRKTNDGGNTWSIPTTPAGAAPIAVSFINSNVGYAVGSPGILKTIDSGATWASVYTSPAAQLNAFHFTDSATGIVVGNNGAIIKTIDAGAVWIDKGGIVGQNLTDVFFVDNNTGFAVGANGTLLKTGDGGLNWVAGIGGGSAIFRALYFVDASIGYAVGETGMIVKTSDGGNVWTLQSSGNPQTLSAVHFINKDTGYVAGDAGVLKTTNGGMTWTWSLVSAKVTDIQFSDANLGYAATPFNGSTGPILYKTVNGGVSWVANPSPWAQWKPKICFVDGNVVYLQDGPGNLSKTRDGGRTWAAPSIPSTPTAIAGLWFLEASFLDANVGYAIGTFDTSGVREQVVFKTTDAGTNWSAQRIGVARNLASFHCPSTQTCYAVGDIGSILKFSMR